MKLVVLDDSNMRLYRIDSVQKYHEFEWNGVKTGLIYGFIKTLMADIKFCLDITRCDSLEVISAIDGGVSTIRRTLDDSYKEGRSGRKFDIARLVNILKFIGIHTIKLNGIEGDDIIGTFYYDKYMNESDVHVVVISDDYDFMQIISENCSLWRPRAREYITLDKFKATRGMTPAQYRIVKSLTGDPSDNITAVVKTKDANRILDLLQNSDHRVSDVLKSILSGPQYDMFLRNLYLIDLRNSLHHFDDKDLWRDMLDWRPFPNPASVRASFETLGFKSFLKSWDDWESIMRKISTGVNSCLSNTVTNEESYSG